MPAISVIVPVYQAESLLPQCVESVLSQTFSDWELLLVDDGSRDGSPALCDSYAAREPRIRAFHKPNGGVSSARNLGLEQAAGQCIAFCISDRNDRVIESRTDMCCARFYVFLFFSFVASYVLSQNRFPPYLKNLISSYLLQLFSDLYGYVRSSWCADRGPEDLHDDVCRDTN